MSKLGYAQRIKQRIAELQALIKRSEAELHELQVAERVLSRLGASGDDNGADDGQSRHPTTKGGVATVADMAVAKLQEYGPKDTPELLQLLQAEWRSDLQQTTLSSTLSRAKAAGRISHVGGKWYAIDQMQEPPEGGSQGIVIGTSASDDGGSDEPDSLD